MQRRAFIAALTGAAVWPLAARAQQQQRERVRRIGVLMALASDDPEGQARLAAFAQGLQQSGWIIGQNIRIDYHWSGGNADKMRKYAAELVAAVPDVILAHSSGAVAAGDQYHSSCVRYCRRPRRRRICPKPSAAGRQRYWLYQLRICHGGKWLELLKEISPRLARVAVLRESAMAAGPGQFGAIQAVAPSPGVDLRPIDVRDATEIERDITSFAEGLNGGLIITGSPAATVYRDLIVGLAARHQLPAIYNSRFYVTGGGLISYGPDYVDQFRRTAFYVDRVLKGEKPAELPVQAPTKYELVINFKTAKALGITIPPSLLARADEVIE
jgi:putative tryptophan/tyrosine transport system substrate-binding protein